MPQADKDLEEVLKSINENEAVVVNEDKTKTVMLECPIEIRKGKEQVTVEELTFRRPTAEDWLVTDEEKGQLGQGFRLAARLCGLSYANFKKLDGEDAMLCSAVASTMGKKYPTGEKS